MSEPVNDESREPRVENHAPAPRGILPKNAQAMVIAGISLVMVAAIALSGPTSSKTAAKATPAARPTVIDPNQARIAEYRQRLDEQARKLQVEQAEMLQRKQQLVEAGMQPTGAPAGQYQTGSGAGGEQRTVEDTIREERKKREYASLFSSNVALSYRKDNAATPQGKPAAADASSSTSSAVPTPYTNLLPILSALSNRADAAKTSEQTPSAEATTKDRKADHDSKDRYAALNQSTGKDYRLFEGTVLETVLTNRLTSSFSGPVNCMVTTNIYSHDRQHILIPQGSRVLGEAKRLTNFGEDRLAVVFHRIIMPDGYSLSLDQFKGLNQIGESGLRDQVNHHYAQIFGVSLAIGAIAGLAEANTKLGLVESSSDAYRQGVSSSLAQSSLRILDRYLNVLPTVTIREGHRVKVYLSDDLQVPAYENHRMPGDL